MTSRHSLFVTASLACLFVVVTTSCVGSGSGSSGNKILLGGQSDTSSNEVADDSVDSDGDGLTDIEETKCGTSDSLDDTDADGLTDFQECGIADCDPNNNDTDGDGTSDFKEVSKFGSCTLNNDFDEDGFENTDDCDDEDATINPGAADPSGDGIDSNCRPNNLLCTPDDGELFSCGGEDGYGIRFELRKFSSASFQPSPGNAYCVKAELIEPDEGFTQQWMQEATVKLSITRENDSTNINSSRFAYELDGFPSAEGMISTTSGSPAFPGCGPIVDEVPFLTTDDVEEFPFAEVTNNLDCNFTDQGIVVVENNFTYPVKDNFISISNVDDLTIDINAEMTGYVFTSSLGFNYAFIDPEQHIGHCSLGD